MKSQTLASSIAFPIEENPPSPQEIFAGAGAKASAALEKLEAWHASLEGAAYDVKYSANVGWYAIAMVKKRRAYYFIPKPGNFTLNIILGSHAIVSLAEGPHALTIVRLLKTARHFPEGTLFAFDGDTFDPDLVIACCRAKLAHH